MFNSDSHSETIGLLKQLAPGEGYTRSRLEAVRFMRANQAVPRVPVHYEPGIFIVCQGGKRGYFGGQVFHYDASHYVVLSVPMPFHSETDATPEAPFLALSVSFDMLAVADMVLSLDDAGAPVTATPCSMVSIPLSAPLADATLRLLRALADPLEARLLAPGILRELCFRVLVGEQGGAIRAALSHYGQFGRIARALRRIHGHYHETLDVPLLARDAGLSVPAFHAHFKAITQTSPMQYIKSTRLHQARLMMVRDNLPAAAAAARVGYESASQFSREFKRLFGRPPAEEARSVKCLIDLLPVAEASGAAQTL